MASPIDLPNGYRYAPETIGAQILAVLDGLSLSKIHWVGESSGGIIGLLLAAAHPDRIASLVLCNTPTRIPDHIKRTYALGHASASEAMRASGVGAWCRQTLGNRLDLAHASAALCDWVVREMDRTPPEVAAAMHDCFESVDVSPLLPGITAPVLLLSGDNSPIASAQQKALAETLPNGRVELFAGYGHGVALAPCHRLGPAVMAVAAHDDLTARRGKSEITPWRFVIVV